MVENEMLDSESNKQPCLRSILGTCYGLMAANENLLLQNLPELLEDQIHYGQVREKTFDLLIENLDTASALSVKNVNLRTKKLSLLLLSRLERNLGQHLGISEDKKNHWVWRFFCQNIPRIAALMIMS